MAEEKNIQATVTTAAVAKLKEVNLELAQCLSFVLGLRKKKLNKTQTSTT